jgi:hypothetical protein
MKVPAASMASAASGDEQVCVELLQAGAVAADDLEVHNWLAHVLSPSVG